jgi:hypothetical protein
MMDMDMLHGRPAAWTDMQYGHRLTCSMHMDIQHVHGHAAWKWTCSMDMETICSLDMELSVIASRRNFVDALCGVLPSSCGIAVAEKKVAHAHHYLEGAVNNKKTTRALYLVFQRYLAELQ